MAPGKDDSGVELTHVSVNGKDPDARRPSLYHLTREALPRLENYRNLMSIQANSRPTLDELRDDIIHEKEKDAAAWSKANHEDSASLTSGIVKFGWIKGVFVRCLLCIWGVMLFLRLSWVVGQAGILEGVLVVVLATSVTFLTGISMSAISTNGMIKSGGTYYMISRSLGPEFGASIGLIFSVANAVAVAMYTVGFSEALVDLLKSLGTYVVEDETNSIRIIGTVAIVLQTGIVIIGMEWEAKAQIALLFILVTAMVNFVIGAIVGPLNADELSKGFVGFNASLFAENFGSAYRFSEGKDQTFWTVFSVFFPAATGILAGANISGDLRDPQESIPKGTLLAIAVTTATYLGFALIAGATVVRDALGPLFVNLTEYGDDWDSLLAASRDCFATNETTGVAINRCEYGLMNSFQVMELVALWGPLVYAGCFAATLSSALASFVSAPKVFQALCNDKLYPYIEFFGKGYGKNNEPLRAYILTFFIALAFILIAELNAIAPLISNFFLAAYALVNFSTFHASLMKPIGWRPTFKFYNKWMSLIGGVLCVVVMFLISWPTALITLAVILFLYLVVLYKKPEVNWGSSTQAQTYKTALASLQNLSTTEEHVKNYHPQILVLSGLPYVRPLLVDFAHLITKRHALMVCGHVQKKKLKTPSRRALKGKAQQWFNYSKMKAFFCTVEDMDFTTGVNALAQAYGVGRFKPNILMMGYKANWNVCDKNELAQYFNVIHNAFDVNLAVTILRMPQGLDMSTKITFDNQKEDSRGMTNLAFNGLPDSVSLPRSQSDWSLASEAPSAISTNGVGPNEDEPKPKSKEKEKYRQRYRSTIEGAEISDEIMENLWTFRSKHKNEVIDVWWLYDDGGLTLLLPYIIKSRAKWSSCKLRVFALTSKNNELSADQRNMATLLDKFRIDYSDLTLIPDINNPPMESTQEYYDKNIAQFKERAERNNDEQEGKEGIYISDTEFLAMKERTNRHMRLRELLQEHSKQSSLVVMTLPMPRWSVVSAPLYMSWLDLLTNDMPPFLLVRGNQTSVLTFYS